jgi:hypothetical protein
MLGDEIHDVLHAAMVPTLAAQGESGVRGGVLPLDLPAGGA